MKFRLNNDWVCTAAIAAVVFVAVAGMFFLRNFQPQASHFLEAYLETDRASFSRLIVSAVEGGETESAAAVTTVPRSFRGVVRLPVPAGRWDRMDFDFARSGYAGVVGDIAMVSPGGVRREFPLADWQLVGEMAEFSVDGNRASYWNHTPSETTALRLDLSDIPLEVTSSMPSPLHWLLLPLLLATAAAGVLFLLLTVGLSLGRGLLPALTRVYARVERFLGINGLAFVVSLAVVGVMLWLVFAPALKEAYRQKAVPLTFEVEASTWHPTRFQVFFDRGRGIREMDSVSVQMEGAADTWRTIRVPIPRYGLRALRLDPRDNAGEMLIRNPRLLRRDGTEVHLFGQGDLIPASQIAALDWLGDNTWNMATTPDAYDPFINMQGPFPLLIRASWLQQWGGALLTMVIVLAAVFLVLFGWIASRRPSTSARIWAEKPWRKSRAAFWHLFRKYSRCRRLSTARLYLLVALFFGLLFGALTPPYQSPDEYSWFNRAWMVSSGEFFPQVIDGRAGGFVPLSFQRVENQIGGNIPFHPHVKTSLQKLREADAIPLDADAVAFARMGDSTHSLLPYLPSAAGVFIARQLDQSPLRIFYAGRMGNLLVGTGLVWLALMITPAFRRTLAVVALSPIVVFLSGTNSHDVWTFGLTMVLMAYILRLRYQEGTIRLSSLAVVALLFLAMIASKFVYLAFFPLLLLIPARRFGGPWRQILALGCLGVFLAAAFAVWMAALAHYPAFNYDRPLVEMPYQIEKLKQLPFFYLTILANTFVEMRELWSAQIIGMLGWLDTDPGNTVRYLYLGGILAALFADRYNRKLPPLSAPERLVSLGTAAGIALLILTLFFLIWTEPYQMMVYGVQGRYFIPMIPAALFAVSLPTSSHLWRARAWRAVAFLLVVVSLVGTAFALLERYWE